jgi:hypothetical protein
VTCSPTYFITPSAFPSSDSDPAAVSLSPDGFSRFVNLNAAGSQIGYAAEPTGTHHAVTLRPDHVAVGALGIPAYQNFPRSRCHPQDATAIRVTAPGRHRHHTLPLSVPVCTTKAGRSTSLAVRHHF